MINVGMMLIVNLWWMKCLISFIRLILKWIVCGSLVVVKVLLVCWCVLVLCGKLISVLFCSVVNGSCLCLVSWCDGVSIVIRFFFCSIWW